MTSPSDQQRADDAEEDVRRAWIMTRSAQAAQKLADALRGWVSGDEWHGVNEADREDE